MKDDSGHSPILRIDSQQPEANLINVAAMTLKSNRILIFPTDTVYGIGVLVQATSSPEGIYKLKQRDKNKAIPLLIGSTDALEIYGTDVPEYAKKLAEKHWPGPLTLIVKASASIPKQFIASDGTVALRMPDSKIALDLIAKAGAPIATSSANLQAQAPANQYSELATILTSTAALIIDGGQIKNAQASTIVSCLESEPRVLRTGIIDLEES